MLFENYDIEEFKANNFYAWMGTRTITPACISFEDYMFGGLWTISKESNDDGDAYILRRKKKNNLFPYFIIIFIFASEVE